LLWRHIAIMAPQFNLSNFCQLWCVIAPQKTGCLYLFLNSFSETFRISKLKNLFRPEDTARQTLRWYSFQFWHLEMTSCGNHIFTSYISGYFHTKFQVSSILWCSKKKFFVMLWNTKCSDPSLSLHNTLNIFKIIPISPNHLNIITYVVDYIWNWANKNIFFKHKRNLISWIKDDLEISQEINFTVLTTKFTKFNSRKMMSNLLVKWFLVVTPIPVKTSLFVSLLLASWSMKTPRLLAIHPTFLYWKSQPKM